VRELINSGFLMRENARNEGKFAGTNYLLLNEPFVDLPHTDLPHADNLDQGIYNNIYNNNNNITLDNINLDKNIILDNINLDNKVKPFLKNIVNNILPRNQKMHFQMA
jgi:hypothetical protein